jgi:hypothetical protein
MKDLGGILGLALSSTGVLLIGLSVPLILKRVAMNQFYGVRIARAYESEANWYAINSYGGRVLAIAGALILGLGLYLFTSPPSSTLAASLLALAPVPIVLLAAIPILRFAKRL